MFTLNCKGRLLVAKQPLVMGIINCTPDSFYQESRSQTIDAVLRLAEKMLEQGADILDVGGQSSRPGSERIGAEEEIKRVIEPLAAIHNKFPESFISIDTYHAEVARQAVDAGACIVNDISGGSMDKNMTATVAQLQTPYVLMHMKGTPETMQKNPAYEDVTREVLDYFISKVDELQHAGITDIIIDPGFGFGKTIEHNFELLRKMEALKILNRPILVGLSRKATVYKTLGTTADQALNGTTALNMIGLLNGGSILRVHDVKEARETVKLYEAYLK